MQVLDNGTKLIDRHYEIPLPLRDDNVRFPNNRLQAEKRFTHLRRKMSRNHQFKNYYMKLMKELMSKGYAAESATAAENRKCWYLPHHEVYNQNKPGKIRVVFDLSAEFQGTSINKSLQPGPDLANQIVGVLLRFREEPVAVTGDIEAMYHQVKILVEQRRFLLFLWWKNSDPQNEVLDRKMTAHLFGGVSSPSCCNYALKKTAADNVNKYGYEASTIVERNVYVDNILKSFPNVKPAGDRMKKVRELCVEGGFNLRKLTSNNVDLLRVIPNDLRKNEMKDKELKLGNLTDDKALGVKWNVKDDTLGFIVKMNSKLATRRGLFAALSSICDPLGLAVPFLLKGRQIFRYSDI